MAIVIIKLYIELFILVLELIVVGIENNFILFIIYIFVFVKLIILLLIEVVI